MKEPPKNKSFEAVELRTAAFDFVREDATVNEQERLNRDLLKAAARYGLAVNQLDLVELLKQAHHQLWNRDECFLDTADRLLAAIRKVEPTWQPE